MTDAATIQFLWRYMVHADQQMWSAVVALPDEAYRREQRISLGSVERLVDHVVAAEEVWLSRFEGHGLPFPEFAPATREQMGERWTRAHDRLLAFSAAQTSESLQATVTGRSRLGAPLALPVWAGMLHLSDHSTYHRGQLNSMIKRAGGTPSGVMLTRYAMPLATPAV